MAKLTRTDKAAIISAGSAAQAVARIIVIVVLSRSLSKAIYGTYQQVWLIYFFCLPLLKSDFAAAVYYFWPRAGVAGRRELIYQNIFLHAASGLVFSLVVFFGAPLIARQFGNESLVLPLRIFSLFPLFALPAIPADGILLCVGRPVLVAVTSFANRVTPFAISLVALVVVGSPLSESFAAVVLGAAFVSSLTIWVLMRQAAGSPLRWRWQGVLDQLKFALPMGTSPIVAVFLRWFSLLVVAVFYRDAAMYAVFVNGAFELPVFPILTGSATSVILPEMSAHSKAGRVDLMMAVWHRAIKKVAFLILPTTLFLFAYGSEMILALFSSKYVESVPIFLILLCMLPTRIANFVIPLTITKRSAAVVWGSVLALVCVIGLSLGLVHLVGFHGPAYAAVLTRWVWTGYFIVTICSLLRVRFSEVLPWRYLGMVVAVGLVSAGVSLVAKLVDTGLVERAAQGLALPQVRGTYEFWVVMTRFLAGGVLFGMVFVPLALWTGIFPELERERLRRLWGRLAALFGRARG